MKQFSLIIDENWQAYEALRIFLRWSILNDIMDDKEKIKAIKKVLDNQLLAYYVIIQEIKDILEKWKNQLKNLYD